jgi:hypothetical protein
LLASSLAEVNQQGRIDFSYRRHFHCLMALLRQLKAPVRAAVFGSVTNANEGLWPPAVAAGFELRVVERTAFGRGKRVDAVVVTRICRRLPAGQPSRGRNTRATVTTSRGCGSWWPTATR